MVKKYLEKTSNVVEIIQQGVPTDLVCCIQQFNNNNSSSNNNNNNLVICAQKWMEGGNTTRDFVSGMRS